MFKELEEYLLTHKGKAFVLNEHQNVAHKLDVRYVIALQTGTYKSNDREMD